MRYTWSDVSATHVELTRITSYDEQLPALGLWPSDI